MDKLAPIEKKFADIIWEKAPIKSRELVELAKEKLNWSKSTTYTMIKRLSDRGLFENINSIVYAVISKDEYAKKIVYDVVLDNYNGSFLDFALAYCDGGDSLSDDDITKLKRLVDNIDKK